MSDLLITEGADIALDNGDLVLDPGLGSCVLRSIFTDRRAAEDELSPAVQSPSPAPRPLKKV